jgi:predicted AAA+ superfamily ATPase
MKPTKQYKSLVMFLDNHFKKEKKIHSGMVAVELNIKHTKAFQMLESLVILNLLKKQDNSFYFLKINNNLGGL